MALSQHKDSESLSSTLRRPFDWIPDETISRIFAIGAEDNPKMYWPVGPSASRRLSGSMISPFGQTASLVCRRWCMLTRLRRNAHLWHVFARIGRQFDIDILPQLALFKQVIVRSNGRDIYAAIYGVATGLNRHSEQLFRHITAIGLKLLDPYKDQLAELMVHLPDEISMNFVSGFAS